MTLHAPHYRSARAMCNLAPVCADVKITAHEHEEGNVRIRISVRRLRHPPDHRLAENGDHVLWRARELEAEPSQKLGHQQHDFVVGEKLRRAVFRAQRERRVRARGDALVSARLPQRRRRQGPAPWVASFADNLGRRRARGRVNEPLHE